MCEVVRTTVMYLCGLFTYYLEALRKSTLSNLLVPAWAQKKCSVSEGLQSWISAYLQGLLGESLTFHRIKNSFWKVEGAGFETGFSVPKARALPTHQSYADL